MSITIFIDRKKLLLVICCFFAGFLIYLLTLSNNLSYSSDYIQVPLATEHILRPMRPIFHVLWDPLNKSIYSLFKVFGYQGRSVYPIEILNIFLASCGLALFALMIYEITGSIAISSGITLLLLSCYPLWLEFVHTKLYSGGYLCTILTFYLYTKKKSRLMAPILAVINGIAFLFHVSNVFLVTSTLLYLLLVPGKSREKLINIAEFLVTLILFVTIGYILIYRLMGLTLTFQTFMPGLMSSYRSTWAHFLEFNLFYFLGLEPESPDIVRNWYLVLWLVIYCISLSWLLASSWRAISRSSYFYPCAAYIFLLLGSGFATAQKNPNLFLIMIPFYLILATALGAPAGISTFRRRAVSLVLSLLALTILLSNFFSLYHEKDLNQDFIYMNTIVKPGGSVSSRDIVFANSSGYYYFTYYTKCRVYRIDGYIFSNEYDRLVGCMNYHIGKGSSVKLVVDTIADYNFRLVQRLDVIDMPKLLDDLSRDLTLEPLYESQGGRYRVYSAERAGKFLSMKGSITFADGRLPRKIHSAKKNGEDKSFYLYDGLTMAVEAEGRRRVYEVIVNRRNEFSMRIPVKDAMSLQKIDSVSFTVEGRSAREMANVPVTGGKADLGEIIIKPLN